MRVKVCTNPPLPTVKAWFPLNHASTPTISAFKSILCTSLSALHGVSPSLLLLSVDGFELLDNSELAVLRDDDLVCIDKRQAVNSHVAQTRLDSAASRKRKRHTPTSRSSSTDSETESTVSTSESESNSSDSESELESDSDASLRATATSVREAKPTTAYAKPSAQPKPHVPPAYVPPGCGKPQTRSRNLRRRFKRICEREALGVPEGGPVSGANAVVTGKDARAPPSRPAVGDTSPSLLSLSLRNKNKAKNFKTLLNKPLPPKIIFDDQPSSLVATPECPTLAGDAQAASMPRLIPPSSRLLLPPNLFVTSIDVEAGLHRGKKKCKMRVEYGDEFEEQTNEAEDITLDYGDAANSKGEYIDRLESIANTGWNTLERPTSEKQIVPGTIVGYKALGINPMTHTPEQCLTLGCVVSSDGESLVMRLLRGREQVSFSGPVEPDHELEERHTWDDIGRGEFRLVT